MCSNEFFSCCFVVRRLSQEELVALLNQYLQHLKNIKDSLVQKTKDPNIPEVSELGQCSKEYVLD